MAITYKPLLYALYVCPAIPSCAIVTCHRLVLAEITRSAFMPARVVPQIVGFSYSYQTDVVSFGFSCFHLSQSSLKLHRHRHAVTTNLTIVFQRIEIISQEHSLEYIPPVKPKNYFKNLEPHTGKIKTCDHAPLRVVFKL